jgi:SAM-dependent methyltransferase
VDHISDLVSNYWAQAQDRPEFCSPVPTSWMGHPIIRAYMHRRATDDPSLNPLEWFRRKYLAQPADLGLSLGCGFGEFDRRAIRTGIARRLHANDISTGAIEKAVITADKEGLSSRIQYAVANLDEIVLPPNTYDAVLAQSSIHHVTNLEHLFDQIRTAMKPKAVFFLDEYIGPSRFQTSPFVTKTIDLLLTILPTRYRRNLYLDNGSIVTGYVPPALDWFDKNDPSESVRSAEIMETLRKYFHIVDYRPYGGGILHMLLSGIAGNFIPSRNIDLSILKILCGLEVLLERVKVIGSDFAVIVCRLK